MDEASEAADTGTDAMQTYTDNALPGGSTQYYRVRARNSEGPGPWSAYASNSTPVPPRAPDTPVLTATTTGTNSVRLTWPMPNANGTELATFDGYVLTRWNTHLETPGWSGDIGISSADTTLYLDTGDDNSDGSIGTDEVRLAPGTTYFFRIRSNGAPETAWSTVVQATTVQDAPDRPQEFTATADGENDIDLSWSAPATDGGNDIIHYRIEIWNSSTSSWDLVTTVPATRTAYTHSNRAAGTRYVYRVRAQNRAPTNGGVGPWSTITAATTDAADE
jgi:hypothetical protein